MMDYVKKGQWVVIATTGQIGLIDEIVQRRLHNKDGTVIVQCGAGGPFVKAPMSVLREATGKERQEAEGIIVPEEPFRDNKTGCPGSIWMMNESGNRKRVSPDEIEHWRAKGYKLKGPRAS